ncbi:putative carboxypeptidase [Geobacillus sp. GHH01]|uniref:M15 family metallopeptidase n=1 Tax=Geobacillus sp. GHH01 TaxID=1233873 RepID=UPI0002AF33DA|nr:M15 family metallopeptidase [Geobacillus sp. GHH01]AGE22129.1 putative carboxypeptidase [Geobacillus sp. GHH01]
MNQRWQAAMLVCLLLAGCQTGESGSNGAAGPSGQPPESAVHPSDHQQQGKTSESPVDPDLQLEAKYWNIVKVQNGQKVIQNPDNILVLVNKEQSLPPGYKPADLVVPRVPFLCADPNAEKRHMRAEAAAALEEMFAAARRDGIELVAVSAYRSYERQQVIFAEEVRQKGREKAVQAVAHPGQSEHQTGLAVDISSRSAGCQLTESFGATKEGQWVAAHAHEYGFIIRYPKGKEAVTGYKYEPWHLRYVGRKAAAVIKKRGLTLEEYFKVVKKV